MATQQATTQATTMASNNASNYQSKYGFELPGDDECVYKDIVIKLESWLQDAEGQIAKQKAKIKSQGAINGAKTRQIKKLKADKEQEFKTAKNWINGLRSKIRDLQQDNQQLRQQLQQQDPVPMATVVVDQPNNQSQIQNLKNIIGTLKRAIASGTEHLESVIGKHELETFALKKQIGVLKLELTQFKQAADTRVKDLISDLQQQQKKYKDACNFAEAKQAEAKKLKKQVKELKNKLAIYDNL